MIAHLGVGRGRALPLRVESAARVAETLEAMNAAGVPIVKPLYRDDTLASFRCGDPDGYAIEVYWEA